LKMKNAQYSALLVATVLAASSQAVELPADLAKAVREYDQAQVRGSRTELERLLADDYSLLNSAGEVETKAQFVSESTAADFKLQPFVVTEPIEKVWTNGAVVGGVVTLQGTDGGKAFKSTIRFADIWAKRGGSWQVIYTHVSKPLSFSN
jgi:hypothetical protein